MHVKKILTRFLSVFLLLGLVSFSSQATENYEDYEKALTSFYDKKYDETIIHLKNALRVDESHIPSHLLLAKTLIAQGHGALAETELLDLQTMGVDFNQLITLFGEAYILQDKYRQVIDIITPGYRDKATESQILFLRGRAYLGLNQIRSAEDAFTEALLLQPDFPLAKLGLAQIAMSKNKLERAMHYVDEALKSYEPIANAWILKSMILQAQGDIQSAFNAINQALKISPEHMQARLNRATLYIATNQYAQASPDIDYILDKIPAEPRAKYLKALVNAATGNPEDSEKKLNEVIVTLKAVPPEVMKNNPSYFYLAGVTNFQFGNLDDARRYLQNFLEYKENDLNALRLLAMIAMAQENWHDAKSILTKVNVYYPDNIEILTLLGSVSIELNNAEAAQRYFNQVIKLAPNSLPALTNLIRSDIALGNYQQAIQRIHNSSLLAKALKNNNVEVDLLLIEAYIKAQQFKQAKPYIEKLLQLDPKNSFYHQQYGIVLGFLGEIEKARKAFTQALALNKNNLAAIIHLARMDVVENQYKKAIKRISKALDEFPKNTELMIELADIYQRLGDNKQALTFYEKAYSYDNQHSYALEKLVLSYVANNEYSKAEVTLTSYLNQHNDDINARIMLGDLYLLINQPHKAIEAYKTASAKSINNTQALVRLAKAQLAIDDRLGAIKSLNKAIALDEENLQPMLMLFDIMLKQGEQARAEQLLYRIEKLTSQQTLVDLLRARLAIENKQYQQAEASYRKALTKQQNQQTTLGLFKVLSLQKKYKQADKLLRRWLTENPNDIIADIALAENYINLASIDDVAAMYLELLKKYNRLPILLNNAANVLYKAGKKEQALDYAKEAYEKVPKNVAVIDTLAWILSRNGEHQRALPLFREALVLDFNNPEVKYHLAVTLAKQKRLNEARKLLIEAVKSERDFSEKEQAKKLLAQWLKVEP